MFGGLAILLLFLLLGELVSALGVGIPGNVIGMILITIALSTRLVKVEQVKAAVDVLLDNLAFFFVPPGVGLMVHAGLIAEYWLPISIAVVVSTVLVLTVVGRLQQALAGGSHDRSGSRRAGRPGPQANCSGLPEAGPDGPSETGVGGPPEAGPQGPSETGSSGESPAPRVAGRRAPGEASGRRRHEADRAEAGGANRSAGKGGEQ